MAGAIDGRIGLDSDHWTGTAGDHESEEVPFACNICFHTVTNPVATACGHLFCWLCLYAWLGPLGSLAARPCPVCRTEVRRGVNIIPIYTTDGSVRSETGAAAETSTGNAEAAAPETPAIPERPHPPSPHRMAPIPLSSPPGTPRTYSYDMTIAALVHLQSRHRVDVILDDVTNNIHEVSRERVDQLRQMVQELIRSRELSVQDNMDLREQHSQEILELRQQHRQEIDRMRRQHVREVGQYMYSAHRLYTGRTIEP